MVQLNGPVRFMDQCILWADASYGPGNTVIQIPIPNSSF